MPRLFMVLVPVMGDSRNDEKRTKKDGSGLAIMVHLLGV